MHHLVGVYTVLYGTNRQNQIITYDDLFPQLFFLKHGIANTAHNLLHHMFSQGSLFLCA